MKNITITDLKRLNWISDLQILKAKGHPNLPQVVKNEAAGTVASFKTPAGKSIELRYDDKNNMYQSSIYNPEANSFSSAHYTENGTINTRIQVSSSNLKLLNPFKQL